MPDSTHGHTNTKGMARNRYDVIVIGIGISGCCAALERCESWLRILALEVGYNDMASWYSHVEKFIGVCGTKEGIESMTDGEFLPAYELNCVKQHLKEVLRRKFKRYYVSGRWAQVT